MKHLTKNTILCLFAVGLCATLLADEEPWVAPARAAKKKNPVTADADSIAKGKVIYVKECLTCHGTTGKGDGPSAAQLERPPGKLSDPKLWEQSDGALFWKITEGRKPMPSTEKTLTEDQRWLVIAYVRTLSPRPASLPPPGETQGK